MKPLAEEMGLEGLEILSGLTPGDRARLIAELKTASLKRGETLVCQGDEADALFIVVSGRFGVFLAGRPAEIAEIGPGQPVGEIAFLAGGRRTASVVASRDSLVLRLDRDDFDRLTRDNPDVWRALTVALAGRLAADTKAMMAAPIPRPRTIAIVRAGGSPLPDAFVPLFAEAFRKSARTRFVTPHELVETLGPCPDLEGAAATGMLNALEAGHDYVVYVADPEPTAWSQKAIRQADLVLAVGWHEADTSPNALEALAAQVLPAAHRRLVLLRPRRSSVIGTARWLRARDIAMHHHAATDGTADFERLFRFIHGTAMGLVACGGGAFCAAHTGVYQALTEAGYQFDIMGGTSGGSAFTAAFALGAKPEQIDTVVHDIFVTNRAMRRYTWPRYSLLDHTHYDRQLARHFGGIDIEDLWIPYFAVSTNLSSYKLECHRDGALWAAVRASGSIPVLLPPYYTETGEMLVDGCLLDNVPIKVMRDIKTGPNVVVSFSAPELERFTVDYERLPSRGALLRSLVTPWGRRALPDAPPLHSVLLRSLMANRLDYRRHLGADDLMLSPPFPADMGALDWQRHAELKERSYAWARAEIGRVRSETPPGGGPSPRPQT